MSTHLVSHNKTLSFRVKGSLDPQCLHHQWPNYPMEAYLQHHLSVELDLSACKQLEPSSIHWIGTLYKRCCHLNKPFHIKQPKGRVKKQILAMELDFLLEDKKIN